jgi:NAD(P)-dependent dehydrogenase (short-subunit alcohol dehydrogenase family)
MGMNQTAIVTGASRGIGRGIALALGREGFNVVINYASSADAARDVQRQIETSGSGASAAIVQADISRAPDRQRLVDEALRAFGRIDLLVNNAGVAPSVRADLLEAGEESFDRLIGINLKGPYFLTQLVARQMISQAAAAGEGKAAGAEKTVSGETVSGETVSGERAPRIITISSMSAYTASVNRGDYCVAKAGLSMMTQLFAARLAEHGIGVYEIRPGIIETDMTGPVKAKYDKLIFDGGITPIRRWGRPEDVAAAVVAIARGLFPFSTGEVFNVDGGFHMRTL